MNQGMENSCSQKTSEELLDIVDDFDNIVGKEKRGIIHRKKLTHRSVMFFLFDKRGRILVNKRSNDKEFFSSLWSIVLGGHLGCGQTYEDAVVREAFEEAKIDSKPFPMGDFKKRIPEESENVKVFGFICDKEPKLLKEEIESGTFEPYDKVKVLLTEHKFIPETKQLIQIYEKWMEKNRS